MPNPSAPGSTPEFPEELPPPEGSATAAPEPVWPVWRGLDVAIILLITLFSMVVALVMGTLVIALAAQVRGWHLEAVKPLADVRFLLLAQTAGLAAGFGFAAFWIKHLYEAPFWRSIAWRRIALPTAGAIAAGGLAFSIFLQFLGHYLPMPRELPIDRLFSSRTAWALAIYGVAIAPFFEEFLFRGLIYPSLHRTFREGMTAAEARDWRPVLWIFAIILATLSGFVILIRNLRHMANDPRAEVTLVAALVMGLGAGPLLQLLAGLLRWIATWNKPELLAILLTGFLFGLVHSAQLADAVVPVLMLTTVGVILTAIRARTGSLVASWVFHCAYNGTLFIMLFASTRGFHDFQHLIR